MVTGIYKGFSTYQYDYNKSFTLLDVEVVKRDLLNHIFTRFGERVHMATFGTRIPDLLFEPLDDNTLEIIETDLTTVFNYDPRVELLDLIIKPDFENNSVLVSAKLNYIELNLNDILDIKLEFET